MNKMFRALVVDRLEENVRAEVREMPADWLPQDGVTIRVAYSSINYKDGLAAATNGKIVNTYPFVPGIDAAGTVERSESSRYQPGDRVLVTGYGLGVARFGGLSEYCRVPAEWIVPMPDQLGMKEAMSFGTAGFTAALSVYRLQMNGLRPGNGQVVVTGATGGVGSVAVALLGRLGYDVAAVTGKRQENVYLRMLGAGEIIDRGQLTVPGKKALLTERWAGAVDPVGGETLSHLLRTMKYGGSVALSGLAGGAVFDATVYPFILGGINLLGIDSVWCPMELRLALWERLAGEWKPDTAVMNAISREIGLEQVPEALSDILQGQVRGRLVVRLSGEE